MAMNQVTAERMQIYTTNGVYVKDQPLYELIFKEARKLTIAGATVTKGILGFGSENLIRGKSSFLPANDTPIKIELIDTPEKLDLLLPFLEKNLTKGAVVREPVTLLLNDEQLAKTKKIIADTPSQ